MLLKERSTCKEHARTGYECPEGKQKCLLYSLTSVLDVVVDQRYTPAASPPGREIQYPLYSSLGGPRSRSDRAREVSSPPGFDSRNFQHLTGRYTDSAVPGTC